MTVVPTVTRRQSPAVDAMDDALPQRREFPIKKTGRIGWLGPSLSASARGRLRVAELAASGQTNRQIAQALFITQRTVENHLTGTYGKLGIGSGSELPAALDASRSSAPVIAGSPRM